MVINHYQSRFDAACVSAVPAARARCCTRMLVLSLPVVLGSPSNKLCFPGALVRQLFPSKTRNEKTPKYTSTIKNRRVNVFFFLVQDPLTMRHSVQAIYWREDGIQQSICLFSLSEVCSIESDHPRQRFRPSYLHPHSAR